MDRVEISAVIFAKLGSKTPGERQPFAFTLYMRCDKHMIIEYKLLIKTFSAIIIKVISEDKVTTFEEINDKKFSMAL